MAAETGNDTVTVSLTRDVEDQLSDGLIPIYRMTRFFLHDIIQSRVLTDMPEEYISSAKAWVNSWPDHWDEWVVFYIGFVVCGLIGIVGFITVLVAALIFPCCRCCGRCGAKVPEKKRKSRCCIGACEISLIVITVSMILANIPLYAINSQLNEQLKNGVFEDINTSLSVLDVFFKQIPDDIEQGVYVGYVEMETAVFATLDGIPYGAMTAIDDATGAVTTLTELSGFTDDLDRLNATLYEATVLASSLEANTSTMWNEFSLINDSITAELTPCLDPNCQVSRICLGS